MSSIDRVRSALMRVAVDRSPKADGQPVLFDSAQTGVEMILVHVDSILMTRRMTLDFGSSTNIVCDVAGRRIMDIISLSDEALAATHASIIAKDGLGPDDAAGVAELLLALCADGDRVAFTRGRVTGKTNALRGGVSSKALRDSISPTETADPDAPVDRMEAWIETIAPHIQTALWVEEEEWQVIAGDDDSAAVLQTWAEDFLDRFLAPDFPLAETLETDGILTFGLTGEATGHLAVVGRLGQFVVASVEGGSAAQTLMAWRALSTA